MVRARNGVWHQPYPEIWLEFRDAWRGMAHQVHQTAIDKGWWDNDRSNAELIALCHSELSEALEALREDNPVSTKIPGFSQAEEELADLLIRVADMSVANDWDIAGALQAKAAYNWTRPVRHGGKKF